LLDVQPGLTKVIGSDDGTNTERYIHGPRGIHAMEDSSGNWLHPAQDGLGSVRMQLDDTVGVDAIQNIGPYGDLFGTQGTIDMPFGFTGEQVDSNNLVYLRARYYDPSIGVFNALDPYEGTHDRAMSLNGYSWVEGNPVMNVDPSGKAPPCGNPIVDGLTRLALRGQTSRNVSQGCRKFCVRHVPGASLPSHVRDYVDSDCVNRCLSESQQAINAVYASTVVISPIASSTPNCSTFTDILSDYQSGNKQCWSSGQPQSTTSLGTVIVDGIITHDHFGPTDQSRSYDYIQNNYLAIYISGAYGETIIDVNSLANYPASSILPYRYGKGTTVLPISNASAFGAVADISAGAWDRMLEDKRVYFPMIAGDNTNVIANQFRGYVPHSHLEVSMDRFRGRSNKADHRWLLEGYHVDIVGGDSGGGHFNIDGSLIGALKGADEDRHLLSSDIFSPWHWLSDAPWTGWTTLRQSFAGITP
jgi:RHS repeat-associated protein